MSIRIKLFFTFLLLSTVLVLMPATLSWVSFDRGLDSYLGNRQNAWLKDVVKELEAYHHHYHNWKNISQQRFWLLPVFQHNSADDDSVSLPSPRLVRRLSLLDANKHLVAGPALAPNPILLPLKDDGKIIGWLAHPRVQQLRGEQERHFQDQQGRLLVANGLLAIALAIIFSWLLARHLVTPITTLSSSTRRLTKGDYHYRHAIHRHDELGQLAHDINQLADTLEAGRTARDRWLADISHELRTPVAVLQGEIQALVDGVRMPDAKRLESLEQEVTHLRKLLDDLHDLSLADSGSLRYRMEKTDLAQLIQESLDAFGPKIASHALTLETHGLEGPCPVQGDDTRLRQLLHNLLDNSVKYTDAGGKLQLTLENHAKVVRLTLADSAPGVTDSQLPHLFDHLYRVENSRNRTLGGSGLGLAISLRIAEAHQGTLTATHSPWGGLAITLTLPGLAYP